MILCLFPTAPYDIRKGLSVTELKARAREEEHAKQHKEAASNVPTTLTSPSSFPSSSSSPKNAQTVPGVSIRKDSAPFKVGLTVFLEHYPILSNYPSSHFPQS